MFKPRKLIENWDCSKDLEIYTTEWIECDETISVPTTDENDNYLQYLLRNHNKKYNIFAFGNLEDGSSVCIRITDYNPYYYIKIPESWNQNQCKQFERRFLERQYIGADLLKWDEDELIEQIQNNKWFPKTPLEKLACPLYKTSLLSHKTEIVNKEIFWTFSNHQKYDFWKLSFSSKSGAKEYHNFIKSEQKYPVYDTKPTKLKLFESDLEPLLRYYHDKNIKPSSWLKIPGGKYTITNDSYCQLSISVNCDHVFPLEKTGIPKFRVASFDIEAGSSHGDFPIAKKDTKKLANQLVIAYLRDKIIIGKNKNTDVKDLSKDELEKYNTAVKNINTESQFFVHRIIQAVSSYLTETENYIISNDPDISPIYFKPSEHRYVQERISSSNFIKICNDIYNICNRPIKKIKANREMKNVITRIMKDLDLMESRAISKNKPVPTIEDLITIIKSNTTSWNLEHKDKKIHAEDVMYKIITKDILVKFVNNKLNIHLGKVEGDRTIQIGTTFYELGDEHPCYHNIVTLGSCKSLKGIDVEEFPNKFNTDNPTSQEISMELNKNELKLHIRWSEMIREYDPDIIIGYNIFGFDEIFMFDRVVELSKEFNEDLTKNTSYNKFINMGRLKPHVISKCRDTNGRLIEKKLASSALGANYLYYFNMPGRVQIDLLKVIQGDPTMKLPSYKLDSVAETFIGGEIIQVGKSPKETSLWIKVDYVDEIQVGNYIIINMCTGEQFLGGQKIKVKKIEKTADCIKAEGYIKLSNPIDAKILNDSPKWGLAKDDVSPKDIFRLQMENSKSRSIIAKYCIQDCALVVRILNKLKIVVNNFAMSNVCLVPFNYIFMRGQSIKIFSLVVRECSLEGYVIPVLEKQAKEDIEKDIIPGKALKHTSKYQYDVDEDNTGKTELEFDDNFNVIDMSDDGYEGAIVLVPTPGIYVDTPIAVLDFASLYPSEMIAGNISHDSYCENEYWLGEEGGKRIRALGHDFEDRTYDILSWVDPTNKSKGKYKTGEQTDRFVIYANGEKGLLPKISNKLLDARKATKKEMKSEKDPFNYAVLDGRQLAFKVTGNSLYGQLGAETSKIYKKPLAASITFGGRKCIYKARDYALKNNPGCEIIYGDSIPGDEYVLVKIMEINTEITVYDTIQNILNKFFSREKTVLSGKYYYLPKDESEIYSYTETGWTKIQNLMCHHATNDIYRIETTSGIVRTTACHSLILHNNKPIKPTELCIGDILLTCNIPHQLYQKMGLDMLREKHKSILDGVVINITNLGKTDMPVYDFTTENGHFQAGIGNIVVHNTDSIFVKFNLVYPDGTYPVSHVDKIQRSIDIGLELQQKLKDDKYFTPPHDLEYEKVFCPLMLITKKRYAGEKYTFDPTKSEFTSMGIVLKRRDNAPILKYTYQGVMNNIMKDLSIPKAITFVKKACQDILDGKFDLNMFVISKTLRDYYKDPDSIAHKVLADRMTERDPGNKPSSNERIPYVYIQVKQQGKVNLLQGDKIEHIDYVKEHNLKLDYFAYINNQLMKPICQVFELVVETMKGYPYHATYFDEKYETYYHKYNGDVKKTEKKISELKQQVVAKLLFEPFLVESYNKQNNITTLDKWFAPTITEKTDETENPEKTEKTNKLEVKRLKQGTLAKFFK